MKRINFYLFVTMAMLMLSVNSAWAQYVKVTAEDGTVSWIKIEGTINGTNIEIYKSNWNSAIDKSTKGSLDLNEVWSESGGRGTNYQVTSIGGYAFYDCSGLTSVTIPSSVTSIGNYAFSGSGLTSVTIPSSVTKIGQFTFQNCSNLSKAIIKEGENSLSFGTPTGSSTQCTFRDCPIETIYLGRNVSFTGSISPFQNMTSLITLNIGNSVTSIVDKAFDGCNNLNNFIIPNNVTSIGNSAFSGCSGLTSVTIPNSVITIGDFAFSWCNGLTSIDVGSSVTSIGNSVFSHCSGLTSVTIPNSVISIGNSAFSYCSGLTSVAIPNSVISIGNSAFRDCSGLTSVDIGSSVTSIGNSAFQGCNCLISVTIPNSVTSVGDYAFRNCSKLCDAKIGSGVKSIGVSAFSDCTNLKNISSEITDVFVTGTNAFAGCENATLHVPAGTYVAYSGRADWNRIIHIVEGTEGFKMTMACNTKGKVLVNNETIFTNKIKDVEVNEEEENTFEFIPNEGCKLEQVTLNGLDVISSVKNNTLKAVIPANSQMNVVFSKTGDINNDGNIDISDVVSLVNMILGQ